MKILQPDGTHCYTGPDCKRHGKFNKAFTILKDIDKASKSLSYTDVTIYDLYKEVIRKQNWRTFPYLNNTANLTEMHKRRIELWAVRNDISYLTAEKLAVSEKELWQVIVHPEIRRQSWQETALFGHLATYENFFSEVQILPKAKTNAMDSLTLKNGILVKNVKNVVADDGGIIKTLDGFVKLKTTDKLIYIITKYTEGKGGSQDNQANEALRSLKQQTDDNDFLVAAILDGDYYQNKVGGKTWIERHNSGFAVNSFIGTHTDFLRGIKNGEIF